MQKFSRFRAGPRREVQFSLPQFNGHDPQKGWGGEKVGAAHMGPRRGVRFN